MDVIVQYSWGTILAIVLAYILIISYLAFRAHKSRIDQSSHDFFATKWTTGWVGIAFTIAAAMGSAGYVMGTQGMFYRQPPVATGYVFAVLFAPWLIWMIGRRLWLLGRRYGYITFPEFIGDYYNSNSLRIVVSALILLLYTPYYSVMFAGPAMLLEAMTGGMIPYQASVLGVGVIAILYVIIGGLRSVIWTDIFQGGLMYLMFFIAVPVAIIAAGGLGNVFSNLPQEKFLYPNTANNWMMVVSFMVVVGFAQTGRPDRGFRLFAAKNMKAIKHAAIASVVLLGLWGIIPMLNAWSYNVALPGITPFDLIMPVGLSTYAPWLMPLFLIAVIAGGMSTLDSGLIGNAAMVTRDIYERSINPNATEKQIFNLSRLSILFFGVLSIIVALTEPPYLWYFIGAAGVMPIQWTPAMLFALYWKRSTAPAAWVSIVGGIILAVLFQYVIPCPWPGPGGPAIMAYIFSIPAFVIISLLTKPMPKEHVDKFHGLFEKAAKAK